MLWIQEYAVGDWSKHRNKSDASNHAKALCGMGCVFLLSGIGMGLMVVPEAIKKGQYSSLLVLVFAIVGLLLLVSAYRSRGKYSH